MLFNSFVFIFVFLPIVLTGYYTIGGKSLKQWFLLLSSIVFYCYWSSTLVFLLFFTVVLDFFIAHATWRSTTRRRRKRLLLISLVSNLSILGFFKYFNFFATSLNGLLGMTGWRGTLVSTMQLALPIGISFYTFQSMCYVIDVYRRASDAHANLLSFAGYVTMFPHQISGPLVRHNKIIPQLEHPSTYVFHPETFWRGVTLFVVGLSKKVLVADLLAHVVDPLVGNLPHLSWIEAVLAMLGYTFQLYFDFSGYTDMAIGLGLMMNIKFPQNFNSPYQSHSITDFWRRWHMTLSAWLRDYLYISLGGNRAGRIKAYRNLMLTMAIGRLLGDAHERGEAGFDHCGGNSGTSSYGNRRFQLSD